MPIPASNQFIYIELKCLLCMCVTVETQFDNTITCIRQIICVLHSVDMLPSPFAPPIFENSGSAPD